MKNEKYHFNNEALQQIAIEFESYSIDYAPVFIDGVEGIEVDIVLPIVLEESARAQMFFYEGYSSYVDHPNIRVRVNELLSDLPNYILYLALEKCNELNRDFPSYMKAGIDGKNIFLTYDISGSTPPGSVGKIAFDVYIDTKHHLELHIESLVKSIFLEEADSYYFEHNYYYSDYNEKQIKDARSRWTVQNGYVVDEEDEWDFDDEPNSYDEKNGRAAGGNLEDAIGDYNSKRRTRTLKWEQKKHRPAQAVAIANLRSTPSTTTALRVASVSFPFIQVL